MTDDLSQPVLDRLRAVDWHDESDIAWDHGRSRIALMREYLRRAALWAKAYHAEDGWPFFNLAEYVDPPVQVAAEVTAELDDFIAKKIGRTSLKNTCRGAVWWPAFLAQSQSSRPDLPDLYEPLLVMYERGGGFSIEQFIDLGGVSVPFKTLDHYLDREPITGLDPNTLDALDNAG